MPAFRGVLPTLVPFSIPTLHGEAVMILSVRSPDPTIFTRSCPGLFYTTAAQDGHLIRIRVPGGLLTSQQCRVLLQLCDRLGKQAIDITNRANLQIRGLSEPLPEALLSQLQQAKLAAPLSQVDHLRNIMASPLAGIDPTQLIDTRPLVSALDEYLSSQPALASLSAKFSLGLDGGEQVSIRQQPNDLRLIAVQAEAGVEFQLKISGMDETGSILLNPSDCVAVVAAIAHAYQNALEPASQACLKHQARLKQVVQTLGSEAFLARVQAYLPFPLRRTSALSLGAANFAPPIGIFPQAQAGQSALGIALPLGRLEINQLEQLANLADGYGSGSLRLTAWRSLILTDLADADLLTVKQQVESLGVSTRKTSIWAGLMACSGKTGCASSLTDTQTDAMAIAAELDRLDLPLTIHFSGCPKSCAHHGSSDITLVGAASDRYHLYIGSLEPPFGRQLLANLPVADLLVQINKLLSVYQRRRWPKAGRRPSHPSQSFREFVDQHPLGQLQAWLEEG